MRFRGMMVAYTVTAAVVLAVLLNTFDQLISGEEFSASDFASDFVEMLLLVSAMALSVLVIDRLRSVERDADALRAEVSRATEAGADWRRRSRKLFEGLSEAILVQFEEWNLTPAEADIAGLILKGASLKQIAEARRTSEATIRQQAQNIYRKSGLGNRAALSAYFLEDLFDIGALEVARPADGTRSA